MQTLLGVASRYVVLKASVLAALLAMTDGGRNDEVRCPLGMFISLRSMLSHFVARVDKLDMTATLLQGSFVSTSLITKL